MAREPTCLCSETPDAPVETQGNATGNHSAMLCPHTAAVCELVLDLHSSPETLELLAGHLDRCPICVGRLETLLSDPALRQVLSVTGRVGDPEQEIVGPSERKHRQ